MRKQNSKNSHEIMSLNKNISRTVKSDKKDYSRKWEMSIKGENKSMKILRNEFTQRADPSHCEKFLLKSI